MLEERRLARSTSRAATTATSATTPTTNANAHAGTCRSRAKQLSSNAH